MVVVTLQRHRDVPFRSGRVGAGLESALDLLGENTTSLQNVVIPTIGPSPTRCGSPDVNETVPPLQVARCLHRNVMSGCAVWDTPSIPWTS